MISIYIFMLRFVIVITSFMIVGIYLLGQFNDWNINYLTISLSN